MDKAIEAAAEAMARHEIDDYGQRDVEIYIPLATVAISAYQAASGEARDAEEVDKIKAALAAARRRVDELELRIGFANVRYGACHHCFNVSNKPGADHLKDCPAYKPFTDALRKPPAIAAREGE